MPGPFAITAATNTVLLDSSRQGQTSFTVSNTTTRSARGRARVVPISATAGPWLTLLGEAERDFASSSTQQYTVQISVPPGAPANDYTFRLDMVDLANPDEDFSEGPSVRFVVAPSVPVKKPFPWWIVAAAVATLLILSGGAYGISRLLQKVPTATLTPTATTSVITPTAIPLAGHWQRVAPMLTATSGLAATTGRDGRIYVVGGEGSDGFLSATQVYDPATDTWSSLPNMPLKRRDLAAVTGSDGRIYAIGGENRSGDSGLSQINEVDVYDPGTNSWSTVTAMPSPRSGVAAVTGPDGRIYVFGGSASGSILNTVEFYTPSTNTWSIAAPMPTARSGAAAVLGRDGLIYVIGGSTFTGVFNTVEAYNPATNRWTTVAHMLIARTLLAAALGPDGLIYAIGGFDFHSNLSTVEAYNPKTNTWTTVSPLLTARRAFAGVLGSDGRIYAIGGDGASNTVEAFSLSKALSVGSSGKDAPRILAELYNPSRRGYDYGYSDFIRLDHLTYSEKSLLHDSRDIVRTPALCCLCTSGLDLAKTVVLQEVRAVLQK